MNYINKTSESIQSMTVYKSAILLIVKHQYRQFSVGNLATGHWTQTFVVILEVLRDTDYEYEISFLIALTVFEIYLATDGKTDGQTDGQTEQIYKRSFRSR